MKVTGGGTIDDIRLTVEAPSEIAVHEFGAEIRAKSKKYLAIPVLFGLRADGTPKAKGPKSYTRYKPFVFTSKDGRKFLAYRTAGGDLRVIYRLIESIRIGRRLRLNAAFDRRSGEIATIFGKLIVQEFKRTNWYDEVKTGAAEKKLTALQVIKAGFAKGLTRRL